MAMPILNAEQFSKEKIQLSNLDMSITEYEIVQGIIVSRGKNKNRIRTSRPEIKSFTVEENSRQFYENDAKDGCIAYIWREIVFCVGTGQHQCLPTTSQFYLPYFIWDKSTRFEKRNLLMKELSAISDRILNTIPKSEWQGIKRWASVLR